MTHIPSRCHSVPAEDHVEQDPNALYDNYPLSAIIPNSETADKGSQRSSTPPLPPERKFVPTGDQLGIKCAVKCALFFIPVNLSFLSLLLKFKPLMLWVELKGFRC